MRVDTDIDTRLRDQIAEAGVFAGHTNNAGIEATLDIDATNTLKLLVYHS